MRRTIVFHAAHSVHVISLLIPKLVHHASYYAMHQEVGEPSKMVHRSVAARHRALEFEAWTL